MLARIRPFAGTFADPALEAEFRAALWPEWSRRVVTVSLLAGVLMMAFCYMDYRVLGPGLELAAAWGVRGAFLAVAVAGAWAVRSRRRARRLDATAFGIMLALSTAIFALVAIEHKGILREAPSTLLALVGFYLFVPARFALQFAAAAYLSVGFLAAQALWGPPAPVEFFSAAVQILICNVLAGFTALHGHKSKRREWIMLREVRQRESFEELVAAQSTRFISLPVEKIGAGIDAALGEVGVFADADRCYVFEWDLARRTLSCTHEWCAAGVTPALGALQDIAFGAFPWSLERLQRGEVVLARTLSDLPPEAAAERLHCERHGVQSLAVVPLTYGGEVLGSVGFQSVRREVEWGTDFIALLRMVGEMIVGVIVRRRIEQELRQQKIRLQNTVAALERSNADLQQFAYAASHDLQEPLRGIASFSGLLGKRLEGRLDEKAAEYLRYLVDSVRRLHSLINDLLTYSRLDGRSRPHTTCDAVTLVREAVFNLSSSIEESSARIQCDPLPVVEGDPALLLQLFQNLLSNAIKFHNGGAPDVRVSARPRGRKVEFAIADKGIGVEPRYARKVFEVFTRLNTVDQYPGTGIGLAVCKRIVARHRGHIWIEPNRPNGTIVHFTLPAASA